MAKPETKPPSTYGETQFNQTCASTLGLGSTLATSDSLDIMSRYRYNLEMKVSSLIKRLAADGWVLARTRGDHLQYKHATKPGLVTIAGHLSDEVDRGTLNSILKQAGLKE